ncbi:hypothetical protein K435DRAFT_773250 [Dendrothele bispora CBS 962.96]|uniref:Uncharacterized protein n=1 Tax=Dendrothele bispora (strain CBS 962.96) TaxID=1314807 RepID=A0A4V4HIH1_DENBC|nr:hypothetical protein K435DRAFT_773250 [Dendrothele bispora CBS 962.96]
MSLRRFGPIVMAGFIGVVSGIYIFRPLILESVERESMRGSQPDKRLVVSQANSSEPAGQNAIQKKP